MKKRKKIFIGMLVMVICLGSAAIYDQENKGTTLDKDHLIRLHVIANSDSVYDQKVKLLVRDEIIKYLAPFFRTVQTDQAAREAVRKQLPSIVERANQRLNSLGTGYTVCAQFGRFDFPTKAYGDLILPSGNYEAVRVVLGEGKGKNWWCVLYPPLCFIDISSTIAVDTSNSNSSGEVESVGGEPVQIEIRLKILDKVADFIKEKSFALSKFTHESP